MKSSVVAGMAALMTSIPIQAIAQTRSLASTMDVYVFPTEGQDGKQQSTDEAACYEWAVSNTGSDPFDLAKQQRANEQQSQAELEAAREVGRGAGAGGFVGGAAAGALIGEIANDDAAEGAAWGAGLGAIASRRGGSRVPKFADIAGFVMAYRVGRVPVGRIAVLGFWWWVGWHFFAR